METESNGEGVLSKRKERSKTGKLKKSSCKASQEDSLHRHCREFYRVLYIDATGYYRAQRWPALGRNGQAFTALPE